MVEGKLFKTKLCLLYKEGRCYRHNCSFAHGQAELRQIYPSSNGKRDHRVGDLRDKLGKRFSPRHRYSPARDVNDRAPFHGSSPSRSFEKNRKCGKDLQVDRQSDFSGNLNSSDGAGDQVKRRKSTSMEPRGSLKQQLKEVRSEISKLNQQKSQLRTLVQEKVKEAGVLTSRIRELNSQLSKEKVEYTRTISKVNKFVKAHRHHFQIQEALNRSQNQLQKLGDQLGSDTVEIGRNEEDSSTNFLSDGGTPDHATSPRDEEQNNSYPSEEAQCVRHNRGKDFGKANSDDGGDHIETFTVDKQSQLLANPAKSKVKKKVMLLRNGNDSHQSEENEGNPKRKRSSTACIMSSDKLKGPRFRLMAPSTSMAANAIDELVEVELEESIEVVETTVKIDEAAANRVRKLLLPLPPQASQNTYSQYEGKDDDVDLEGLEMADDDEELEDMADDEGELEEMANVDIV